MGPTARFQVWHVEVPASACVAWALHNYESRVSLPASRSRKYIKTDIIISTDKLKIVLSNFNCRSMHVFVVCYVVEIFYSKKIYVFYIYENIVRKPALKYS